MVSHAQRRRTLGLALTLAAACSRHADIADEPDAGVALGPEAIPDAGIPLVEDAGLDDPSFVACLERPENGRCRGANDFPCDFAVWVPELAEQCQMATGCVTSGWVQIDLADDGCAAAMHMDQPNDAYLACLRQELGAYRCPCAATSVSYFLGIANNGCSMATCFSGELRCPLGEECIDGKCVPEDAGAGGAG